MNAWRVRASGQHPGSLQAAAPALGSPGPLEGSVT